MRVSFYPISFRSAHPKSLESGTYMPYKDKSNSAKNTKSGDKSDYTAIIYINQGLFLCKEALIYCQKKLTDKNYDSDKKQIFREYSKSERFMSLIQRTLPSEKDVDALMEDLLSKKQDVESWTNKNALKIVEKNEDNPEYIADVLKRWGFEKSASQNVLKKINNPLNNSNQKKADALGYFLVKFEMLKYIEQKYFEQLGMD